MGDLPLPERAREHGVHADEHQAGLAVVPDDAPRPEAVPTLDVHGAAAVGEGPFHDRPRGHHVRAALPPLHPGDETRAVPSAHPLDDVDAALGPRGQRAPGEDVAAHRGQRGGDGLGRRPDSAAGGLVPGPGRGREEIEGEGCRPVGKHGDKGAGVGDVNALDPVVRD